MVSPIKIFCCYAHEDQVLLKRLKTHLMSLQRQGLITAWADTDISPGTNWEVEISKHINSAQIILLLISPDFMASNYCYSKEMRQALDRHKQGNACVIPIILRPVYLQGAPFEKLQALPKNAKPLKKWSNIDDGFLNIVEGIQLAIKNLPQTPPSSIPLQLATHQPSVQPISPSPQTPPMNAPSYPTTNRPVRQPVLPNPQTPPVNTLPHITNNQPARQPIPPNPQIPPMNAFSHSISKQPAGRLTLPSPQTPPMNAPSYPTTNQPARQPVLPNPQTPPVNTLPHITNNQPAGQPLISQLGAKKTASKGPLELTIFKIALYFIGVLIAEFGLLGGALTAVEKTPNLTAGVGGIAFFIGIVAFLISTIIFFRKHYYRYHMHCAQYMWLLFITTTAMIALVVLSLSVIPGKSTDPVNSALTASVFFLYGISLIIITYLKPSP